MRSGTRVLSTSLCAVALGACGGKIGASASELAAELDAGGRPVITRVVPSSGPNSGGTTVSVYGLGFATDGGTEFTFAAARAGEVTCSSDTACVMVTPAAGFTTRAQVVDVKATNGGVLGQEGASTSATTGGDVFTYAAGPDCNAAQVCIATAEPGLEVACPEAVTFFQVTTTSSEQVGTGSTYVAPMQCGFLAACVGTLSSGSCSTYTLNAPMSACGDPKFCKKCENAGGFCSSGPDPLCCNGAVCVDTEPPACP